MTERENALKVYHHERPEWIPNLFDSMYYVGNWAGNECGESGEEVAPNIRLDCFGIPWSFAEGTPMPAENSAPLKEIGEWREKLQIPDPDEWDWETKSKIELENYDGTRLLVYFCEEGLFDRLRDVLPFEDALCALMEEPEECEEFFDAILEFKLKVIKNVAKYYHPDVFMYADDIAKSDGLMISPNTYREMIKPRQAIIMKAIRENGMIAEQHTCGKCDSVMGDYVEAGVQSFFPAQACNDLVAIKEKYGDKLTITGGFNSQGAPGLMNAPEEVMREEARRMIREYGKDGGFVAIPVILGGNNFTLMELDTQKNWYDEFKMHNREF